jgi:hypothetical protein
VKGTLVDRERRIEMARLRGVTPIGNIHSDFIEASMDEADEAAQFCRKHTFRHTWHVPGSDY